ncbi:MAG: hypothetical protein LUE64_06935 [Candidatus Gastranaerophilales bacterium]|nr:hypothetical protein [Candidatus Gastranaerophilales bacterium]
MPLTTDFCCTPNCGCRREYKRQLKNNQTENTNKISDSIVSKEASTGASAIAFTGIMLHRKHAEESAQTKQQKAQEAEAIKNELKALTPECKFQFMRALSIIGSDGYINNTLKYTTTDGREESVVREADEPVDWDDYYRNLLTRTKTFDTNGKLLQETKMVGHRPTSLEIINYESNTKTRFINGGHLNQYYEGYSYDPETGIEKADKYYGLSDSDAPELIYYYEDYENSPENGITTGKTYVFKKGKLKRYCEG